MSKKSSWLQKQFNFKNNVSHVFNKKILHWSYCSGCGLLLLRNEVSREAAKRPCKSMEE